jgi:hypothetical protein
MLNSTQSRIAVNQAPLSSIALLKPILLSESVGLACCARAVQSASFVVWKKNQVREDECDDAEQQRKADLDATQTG